MTVRISMRPVALLISSMIVVRLFFIDTGKIDLVDVGLALMGAFFIGAIIDSLMNPAATDKEILREIDEDEHRRTRQD